MKQNIFKTKKLIPLITLPLILLVSVGFWLNLGDLSYRWVWGEYGGVWNLREFDFESESARLYGRSAFIPNVFLTPAEFNVREDEIIRGIPYREGYLVATSRSRIRLPDGYYTFTRISTHWNDRIYVNGVFLHQVGVPADNKADEVIRTQRVTFTARPNENGVVEIIQQSSNFSHRITANPHHWIVGSYGLADDILRVDYTQNIMLGFYLTMVLVFFMLFAMQGGLRHNLYFSLFCLTWLFRTGAVDSKVFSVIAPWISGSALLRIEYIAMPVSAVLCVAIVNELFPGVFQKAFLRIVYALSAAWVFIFLFGNILFISHAVIYCQPIYAAVIVYTVVRLAMKVRKVNDAQMIFISGLCVFLFGAVHDFIFSVFFDFMINMPNLGYAFSRVAILAFTFCQAVAVFIVTMHEVEAAKMKERELAVEKASLERVNSLKTELMRTVSHEMRTPLAVMMGFAQLCAEEVRKKDMGEDTAVNLDAIAGEARRMTILLEELSSPMYAQEFSKDRCEISAEAVIQKIVGLYEVILGQRNISVQLNLPEDLPAVYGNEYELTQVMFNLLRNADKHTENGIITIGAKPADNSEIIVTVADTGEGILPEFLPHVFEHGTSGEKGGMGFGLAICKDIVEAHGKRIWIESEPGKGTVVSFTMPVFTGGKTDV